MKAVVLNDTHKTGLVLLDDYDPTQLSFDESLVKVMACGICGSDYHYFRNGGLGSHKVKFPFKLGHEVSGICIASSDTFRIGDRVAVDPSHSCGSCKYCRREKSNLCKQNTFMGTNSDGGMQEVIKVKTEQLYPLDNSVSFEYGVMMEGLGVAIHNISRVIKTSEADEPLGRVLVLGAGPIGLLTGYIALYDNAEDIVIVDPIGERRNFATTIGLRSSKPSITDEDVSLYDTVFDCAGTQESYDACIRAANPGSRVLLCGIPEVDFIQRNPHIERIKELTILNSRRSAISYETIDKLAISRRVPLEKFITHSMKFRDSQEAFELASSYRDGIIKMVLTP